MNTQMTIEQALQFALQQKKAENFQQAIDVLTSILAEMPEHLISLSHLAALYYETKQLDLCRQTLSQLQKLLTDETDFYIICASLYEHLDDLRAAVDCFDELLTQDGKNLKVLSAKARLLIKLKDYFQAEKIYEEVVTLDSSAANLCDLGLCYLVNGRLDLAEASFQQSLKQNPCHITTINNYCVLLENQGKGKNIIALLKKALKTNKDHIKLLQMLAQQQSRQGDIDAAIKTSLKLLKITPNNSESANFIGFCYTKLNDYTNAEIWFHRAIEFDPNNALAHANLGMKQLRTGDFSRGWQEYEYRLQVEKLVGTTPYPEKKHLKSLAEAKSKIILIVSEQGFGDHIQFIRYAKLLKQQKATIIVQTPEPLIKLFTELTWVDEVISKTAHSPQFDYHIPICSLGGLFKTTLDTIPSEAPYIQASKTKVQHWQQSMPHGDKYAIGFCWTGSSVHEKNQLRSCPIELFDPLISVNNTQFYSLQVGNYEESLQCLANGDKVIDLGKDINDFTDTAAIIANLDLVISVDTALVHLCGAMNKPVWMALPLVCDWRWLEKIDYSPWYPSVRLFRQNKRDHWPTVFNNLLKALSKVVKAG